MPKFHDEKMSRNPCDLFILDKFCFNPNCMKQHLDIDDKNIQFKNIVKVTKASPEDEYKVVTIWNNHSSSTPRTIISVEIIHNKRLQNLFSKREAELKSSKVLWGFHGTAENNIEKITETGFLADFQLRNAYGVGTYFAHDPNVSVGYCGGGSRYRIFFF